MEIEEKQAYKLYKLNETVWTQLKIHKVLTLSFDVLKNNSRNIKDSIKIINDSDEEDEENK